MWPDRMMIMMMAMIQMEKKNMIFAGKIVSKTRRKKILQLIEATSKLWLGTFDSFNLDISRHQFDSLLQELLLKITTFSNLGFLI